MNSSANIAKLSDSENYIMSVIWASEKELTLKEVTEKVASKFNKIWKQQTVATFMKRLEKKGYIEINRIKRYSYYRPLISIEEYETFVINKIVQLFHNGDSADFVLVAMDNMEIDRELIKEAEEEYEKELKNKIQIPDKN